MACYYAYLARKMQNFLRQRGAAPLQTPPGGQSPWPLWTPCDSWLVYINRANVIPGQKNKTKTKQNKTKNNKKQQQQQQTKDTALLLTW